MGKQFDLLRLPGKFIVNLPGAHSPPEPLRLIFKLGLRGELIP